METGRARVVSMRPLERKISPGIVLVLFAIAALTIVGLRYIDAQRADDVSALDRKFDQERFRPITGRDHYRGSLEAEVHVIVFSDTECPYCKYLHMKVLPELRDTYGDSIVIAYRHHLRPQFSRSPREAEATECAAIIGGEQTFWRYLDRLYQITPSNDGLDPGELYTVGEYAGINSADLRSCLDVGDGKVRVREDRAEADRNDIVVAPTVVVLRKGQSPIILPGSSLGPLKAAIETLLSTPNQLPKTVI